MDHWDEDALLGEAPAIIPYDVRDDSVTADILKSPLAASWACAGKTDQNIRPIQAVCLSIGAPRFAEFERSMIRQRVNAGLKRAVEAGKQLGRPRIDSGLEKRIQSQLRAGKGMLKVAAECGVGSGTVQRVKREMDKSRPFGEAILAA